MSETVIITQIVQTVVIEQPIAQTIQVSSSSGATGPQGEQGEQGPAGAKGDKGDPGIQGEAGLPGENGLNGTNGTNGAQGTQGVKGDKGDTGDTGATGLTGSQGIQGIQGIQGTTGSTGSTGAAGTNGATWYNGSGAPSGGTGANGDYYLNTTNDDFYQKASGAWSVIGNIKGATGPQGSIGLAGPQGNVGATGATGATGPAGTTTFSGLTGLPTTIGGYGITDAPIKSTADVTYYVRTNGSDANTGLANTAGGAFLTYAKARSMIPQILNHTYIINIAAGTYAEIISANGLQGSGTLTIIGTGVVNVTQVLVNNCGVRLEISTIVATTTATNPFSLSYCLWAYLNTCSSTSVDASHFGVYIYGCSTAFVALSTFSSKSVAIYAGGGSNVFSIANAGTGNTTGISAIESSKVTTFGAQPVGTTQITGATGVINPWGDNTNATRSHIRVAQNFSQSLAANTTTKIQLNTEITDQLAEYDPATNYRFTAGQAGVYSISGMVDYAVVGTASLLITMVFVNGSEAARLGQAVGATNNNAVVAGSVHIKLNAGDYVELFGFSTVALSTVGGFSYLSITRVA